MEEIFTIDSQGENANKVRSVLQRIQDANVNNHNCQQFFEQITMSHDVINAQIDNEVTDYLKFVRKINEKQKNEQIISMMNSENGVVPIEMYKELKDAHNCLKTSLSWKIFDANLLFVFMRQLIRVVGETKALEIQAEATKQMREMIDNNNQMTKMTIMNMQEIFVGTFKILVEGMKTDLRQNTQTLSAVLSNNTQTYIDLIKDLSGHIGMSHEEVEKNINMVASDFSQKRKQLDKFNEENIEHTIKSFDDIRKNVKVFEKEQKDADEEEVEDDIDIDEISKKDDSFLDDFKKSPKVLEDDDNNTLL